MICVGTFSKDGLNYFFAISPSGMVTGAFQERQGLLRALGDAAYLERWIQGRMSHDDAMHAIRTQPAVTYDVVTNRAFPPECTVVIHGDDRLPIIVYDDVLEPIDDVFYDRAKALNAAVKRFGNPALRND